MVYSEEILLIILRSIFSIIVLIIATKILGKKQLSQLTLYDYIVGITIGSIAADAITDIDLHYINGVIAILTFAIIAYGLSYLSLKNGFANNILNGKPVYLMENGEFNFDNFKKSKITISKFLEQARLNGYYDIMVLDYAILETNGQISFLPKTMYQTCAIKDFSKDKLSDKYKQTHCYNLIIDNDIQKDVLLECGKDEEWLIKELKKLKVNKIENIALVTFNQKEKLKIYKELI